MNRGIEIIASLFLIFMISGCAAFKQIDETRKVIETCEFTLRSIKPSIDIEGPRISLSGVKGASVNIDFAIDVEVTNTTDIDLSFNKTDLRVYVNNQLIATGTTSRAISLPAGGTEILPANVTVDPEKATKKLAKTLEGEKIDYRVDGTFYFRVNGWDVPITVTLKD